MSRKTAYWIIGIVLILVGIFSLRFIFPEQSANFKKDVDPNGLPGIMTAEAPWPAGTKDLRNRLSAIGLHLLASEGNILHIHQHLDIFVDGKKVEVPAGIGIDPANQFISEIHTHDRDGIIHIESPYSADFTLGHFFDVWGVRFTANCLGGYCSDGQKNLRVYVNGKLLEGDPRKLKLESRQEIAVVYGLADGKAEIPSSYNFAPGL